LIGPTIFPRKQKKGLGQETIVRDDKVTPIEKEGVDFGGEDMDAPVPAGRFFYTTHYRGGDLQHCEKTPRKKKSV